MRAGRPLLLGKNLDLLVKAYITALRKAGGVVNTSVVICAAQGIIAAKNHVLLAEHGGHILGPITVSVNGICEKKRIQSW